MSNEIDAEECPHCGTVYLGADDLYEEHVEQCKGVKPSSDKGDLQ